MMKRLALGYSLALLIALWCPADTAYAELQQAPRIAVVLIGFKVSGPEVQAFRQGLRDAGYLEGRDVLLEYSTAEGDYSRLPAVVAEAVQTHPSVLVVETTPGVRAAKEATSTIPIVMPVVADPVASGLVRSLARPGGNLTGLSMMMEDIALKRLQLLTEAVIGSRRIGILRDPNVPFHAKAVEDATQWAKANGLQLTVASAGKVTDLGPAFALFRRNRVQAVCLLDSAFLSVQRETVLKLAATAKLPIAFGYRPWAEAGALLSYTADFTDMFRRAADYVDKILKGAKPGDLPVEQARKFQLIVNLKAAKALGLTLPESLLISADEVIK
jgi:putative tryptophan/tyrosine transport system substrate-binding protein